MAESKDDPEARCLDALQRARSDLHAVQSEVEEADRIGSRHDLRFRQELRLILEEVGRVGERLDRLLRPSSGSSCFPGSARVATPGGPRSIASVRRGDFILSWTPRTSTTAVRVVTAVRTHGPRVLWQVRLEDGHGLVCTPNHRLLAGRGWIRVDRLRAGDVLVRPASGPCGSTVLSVGPTTRREPVFNLVTADEHSYIVDGFVAHNFAHLLRLRTWWHQLVLDRRAITPHLGRGHERVTPAGSPIRQRLAPWLADRGDS